MKRNHRTAALRASMHATVATILGVAIATTAHAVPEITSVNGCAGNTSNYTTECPTTGGISITISGTSFGGDGAQAFVGGRNCPVSSASDTEIVCDLPVGAGLGVDVVVKDNSGVPSMPREWVVYSAPAITSVSGCTPDGLGSTTGCDRSGGTRITINGNNFGPYGSLRTVLVGDDVCPFSDTDATDTSVICNLRPGQGTRHLVRVLSANQLNYDEPYTVSYAQCEPGTKLDSSSLACDTCPAGTFSTTNDAEICDECPEGTDSDAGATSCTAAVDMPDMRCWQAKDVSSSKFSPELMSVLDELTSGQIELKKPAMYCTAADTNGAGVVPADFQQCCYQVKGPKLASPTQAVTFEEIGGARTLAIGSQKLLCTTCDSTVTTP